MSVLLLGIDVIEVLVNRWDFNIMDISIYVICFKIRSNPKRFSRLPYFLDSMFC